MEAAHAYQNLPVLLEAIKQKRWEDAEQTLRELLAKGMALMRYESPENADLRLALRTLEAQIIALTTEQIETEQLIEQFSKRQKQHHWRHSWAIFEFTRTGLRKKGAEKTAKLKITKPLKPPKKKTKVTNKAMIRMKAYHFWMRSQRNSKLNSSGYSSKPTCYVTLTVLARSTSYRHKRYSLKSSKPLKMPT